MRTNLLILSDGQSVHTKRWIHAFGSSPYNVTLATFRPVKQEYENVSIAPLGIPSLGKAGYLLAYPKLSRIFRSGKFDLVHAHHLSSFGFLASLLPKRVPFVVTAWGSDVLVMPDKSKIYRYLARRPLERADYIYTTADNVSLAIPGIAKTSVPIVNLPFGVELSDFPFNPPSASGRLRIFSNRMFKPIYDVQTLIRAAKALDGKADFELRLAGAGPQEAEIREMVREFGLSDKVQFAGILSHAKMAQALAESDIFVSCSFSDSNNISLNEAMAVGTVPVVSRISANTPWVSDGENGFLFEPGSAEGLAAAVLKAVESRERWAEMAKENRALIEKKANWRTCVSETFRTYDELCARAATQSK